MSELDSQLIIATPEAFDCDGKQHIYNWENKGPGDIKIKKSLIWCGMSKGQVSDFGLHLFRTTDAEYINVVGWDHYQDPGGLHQYMVDFHSDWMTIKVGETIRLIAFATSENVPPLHGGALVWIWYPRVGGAKGRRVTQKFSIDVAIKTMLAKVNLGV